MVNGLLEKVFLLFGKSGNGAVYRQNLESAIAGEVAAEFALLKEQVPDPEERRLYLRSIITEGKRQLKELNGHQEFIYSLILDEQPADGGRKKTQDQHIKYWGEIKDGRRMASMGDLYVCFKQLKSDYEAGDRETKERIDLFLTDLREDFLWEEFKNFLIARTRLVYSSDSFNTEIIQHYGSKDQTLIKKTKIPVLEYLEKDIVAVMAEPQGLKYLQVLLDTEDTGGEIVSVLEFISGKDKKKIKVWSASITDTKFYFRSQRSKRAAVFNYYGSDFHIFGNDLLSINGRSRGVSVGPR